MGFDAVVAIARGGLVPALMASTELSVPLHALSYSRTDRCVSWFTTSKPPARATILLVEDIAGRGRTFSDCVEFMRHLDYELYVFTMAPEDDSSEERRVGEECLSMWRSRWSRNTEKKKNK